MIAKLTQADGTVAVLSDLGEWRSREDPPTAAYLNATHSPRQYAAEGPAGGDFYVRAVTDAAKAIGATIEWEEDPDEAAEADPDGPPVIN